MKRIFKGVWPEALPRLQGKVTLFPWNLIDTSVRCVICLVVLGKEARV
jgi:hypothetical protein